MTTPTQPADLLALVAKLDSLAGVIRTYGTCAPTAFEFVANELRTAIASLAANRGEVSTDMVLALLVEAGYLSKWNAMRAERIINSWPAHPPQAQVPDGSMTIEEAVNSVAELFPGADKQALRVLARALTKPPQAQAGAGDAVKALQLFVRDAQNVDLGGGDAVVTTCESLEAAKEVLAALKVR